MEKPVPADNLFWKIIRFPLSRLVIALLWLTIVTSVTQILLRLIPGSDQVSFKLLGAIIVSLAAYGAYYSFVLFIERRPVHELSMHGMFRELLQGVIIGTILFSITIGFIWIFGYYTVNDINSWDVVLPILSASIVAGVLEEIIFRGIFFRIIEESLGTLLALAISALIFGLLHITNPNATLYAGLAIAIEAGILLGAVFILTRRLWLAIGLHFSWNFTQGGIYGVSVSGIETKGILQSTLSGPDWLSGGPFGAEASIFALLIATFAGLYYLRKAKLKGHFVQPFWKK